MSNIIPTIVFAAVLLALARGVWVACVMALRLAYWLGPGACAVLGLLALCWAIMADVGAQPSANAAREAQNAVAKASGRPCDYACKVWIADRTRNAAQSE